ncbi:hypothetical protein, partial [Escherichia coli]|uniref:hypothetical protein n=1 Tax=Escherichia coli TaxID=562 RepID=UPI00387EE68B
MAGGDGVTAQTGDTVSVTGERFAALMVAASFTERDTVMSNRYVIEALLRPAVELNTAVVAATAAGV